MFGNDGVRSCGFSVYVEGKFVFIFDYSYVEEINFIVS